MGRGEKASSCPSRHAPLALYAHSHLPPIALVPSSRGPTEPWEASGGCSNFIRTRYHSPPSPPPQKRKKTKTKITLDKKINHNICIYTYTCRVNQQKPFAEGISTVCGVF